MAATVKTNEELICELHELQQKYDALKLTLSQKSCESERQVLENLINISDEFIHYQSETPDYQKLSQNILDISCAKYVSFNIFDDDGRSFTTVAITGIKNNIQKAFSLLGIDIINKHWKYDASRDKKTRKNIVTRFNNLHELTGNVVSKNTVSIIEKTFGIGEVFIVKVQKDNIVLGDFTLLYTKGETLKNTKFVELYARQVGLFLDRVKAMRQLRLSENKHSAMIANISDVIGITDSYGRNIYKSPNIEKWFGWKPEEVLGNFTFDTVHPSDLEFVKREFFRLVETKNGTIKIEFRYRCKDDTYKPVSVTATNLLHDPTIKGILSNYHDISIRKQADEALRKSEDRFKKMFMQAPLGIALINSLTGRIYEVNPKYAELVGRTPEEIAISDWKSITHPDDIQADLDNMELLNSGKITGFQMKKRYLKPNGTVVWVNMTIAPINNDNKGTPRHLCMVEDITEQRITEEIIKNKTELLTKLNADKDRFMSILGHDLRSPISAIIGLSDIMVQTFTKLNTEKIEEYTHLINKSAKSTFNLLDDILLWARSQSGKLPFAPEIFVLKPVINEVVESLSFAANAKNIQIKQTIDNQLQIDADANMLKTIIRNLVSNAIKFTNDGGLIQIEVKHNDLEITFKVIDNGVGMPKVVTENLFDITQTHTTKGTNNETGTGLGLFLCKDFAEKHGGRIWVESEEDRGTTFYFTLLQLVTKTKKIEFEISK